MTALRSFRRALFPLSILLVVGLLAAAVVGPGDWQTPASVLVFVAAMVLIIPIHELGHALSGWAVGLRVARVIVGVGRPIWQRRIGDVTWQWNLIPLGGATMAAPVDGARFLRARLWVLAFGGPAFHAAVGAAFWYASHHLAGAAAWIFDSATSAAVISLVVNLVPIRVQVGGMMTDSDGRRLVTTPFMNAAAIEKAFAGHYAVAALDAILAGDGANGLVQTEAGLARFPREPMLRLLHATALYRLGRFGDAKADAEIALAAPAPLDSVARNDWAWFAFFGRDERDRRAAERRSAESLAMHPDSAPRAGTRGAVLLWHGRVREARPLLERASRHLSTRHGRADNASLLAMTHAALGEPSRARTWLDRARREDPTGRLIDEAAEIVARAEAGGPIWVPAARGGRAVKVDLARQAIVLVDDGRLTRVAFGEVAAVDVGLTARGRALLIVRRRGGPTFRLPLSADPAARTSASSLTAARLALHPLLGAPPPAPHAIAASSALAGVDYRRVGQMTAFAMSLAVSIGRGGAADLGRGGAQAITLGILTLLALVWARPAPLIAAGTAVLLVAASSIGTMRAAHTFTIGPALWTAAQVGSALLALVAGWGAARHMPRDRRRGLHVTVGVLLGLMGLPVVLGATWFVRHPRGSLLPILIGNQLAVGIEALCLATVIAIIVPRRRVLALAAAILGVGWVLLSA